MGALLSKKSRPFWRPLPRRNPCFHEVIFSGKALFLHLFFTQSYMASTLFGRVIQAASVIQRHWVEAELDPEGEDDATASNQVR